VFLLLNLTEVIGLVLTFKPFLAVPQQYKQWNCESMLQAYRGVCGRDEGDNMKLEVCRSVPAMHAVSAYIHTQDWKQSQVCNGIQFWVHRLMPLLLTCVVDRKKKKGKLFD
jgi:hypothetical protein